MAAIIVNNRIVTFALPTRSYTANEQKILAQLKSTTPISFLRNFNETNDLDLRLLALAETALSDINNQTPVTNFTFDTLPRNYYAVLTMGFQVWIMLFMQMRWSLIDLSYSDSGLSIQVSRVEKIGTVLKSVEDRYQKLLDNVKKGLLLQQSGVVLTSPRFQSNLSRMIGMLGDGAMGWGIP